MTKRLAHTYQGTVTLIREDGFTKEITFSNTVLALDADETKDIALVEFASKTLPACPGYKVGGRFEWRIIVASDAGWNR